MVSSAWTFAPIKGRAKLLRIKLEQQLCQSLASLFEAIEEGLSLPNLSLVHFVPKVDPERPLGSHLYTVHWRIATSIESNQKDLIVPALRPLSQRHHPENWMEISTHKGDFIDGAAENYISSDEGQRKQFYRDSGVTPLDVHTGFRRSNLAPISDLELATLSTEVHRATELLAEIDPAMADEIAQYVRQLRLIGSDRIGGMSSMRFFGTIYLRRPRSDIDSFSRTVQLVQGLVHEASHLHLHAMMAEDPLIINSSQRFESPLRRDPRPMLGIFHATFVLARLAHVFENWDKLESNRRIIVDELRDARSRLAGGIATIKGNGNLTPRGQEVLSSMTQMSS